MATGNVGASATAPIRSAATTTCRARATWVSISRPCRSTTVSPRAPGSTGAASGKTDFDGYATRFDNPKLMHTPGIPATRWFDAAMLPKDQVEQKDNIKALMVFGHSPNTFTRIPVAAQGIEKLDLLVVCDPHPTNWAVLGERKNGTYLLPSCSQYESPGHAYGFQRIASSLPADRQAAVRIEERRQHLVPAGNEARFRRPDVQEHQGRERASPWPRTF